MKHGVGAAGVHENQSKVETARPRRSFVPLMSVPSEAQITGGLLY